jgi:ureidoglycolate hydrolase
MKIRRLTHKSIRPYGKIIDSSCVKFARGDDGFGVLFKERSAGWRVAYLVVRRGRIERLERHPNTAETFEPVRGRAVIALASGRNPERFRLFRLDRPVVLNKGVWHAVAAPSKGCEIKICEGIRVVEEYYRLERPFRPGGR